MKTCRSLFINSAINLLHRRTHPNPNTISTPTLSTKIRTRIENIVMSNFISPPSQPFRYLATSSTNTTNSSQFDLSELNEKIMNTENKRQTALDLSSKIRVFLVQQKAKLDYGSSSNNSIPNKEEDDAFYKKEITNLMNQVFYQSNSNEINANPDHTIKPNNPSIRDGNLTYQIQEYIRHECFLHFLSNGSLLKPSFFQTNTLVSDEEYLAGGCISLCQDLATYSIGRATVRDVHSVKLARNLVNSILEYLLQFDFRNGMLRRKYDGVKYAMKTCETVLYELSVTDSTNSAEDLDDGLAGDSPEERASKKMKVDVLSNESMGNGIMPVDELESIKKRMEHRDELRENLIKRCRDGQKVAKQAIFALHRGDRKQSLRLIKECEKCILHDLLPIVNEEPQLRMGSFGGVVEEYVEAKLFYCWLYGKEDGDNSMNGNNHEKPSGIILKHVDFPLELEADEYLGGLCDFTGEVGRYAVQRGTSRDSNAVQFCLETNLSIQYALEMLHRFPSYGNIGKKMEPLRRSVEKLQRMLYELSLVQATGRQIVADSVNNIEGEIGDKD